MAARKKQQGGRVNRGNAVPQRQAAAPVRATPSRFASDMLGVMVVVIAVSMATMLLVPSNAPVPIAFAGTLVWLFGAGALLVPVALLCFAVTFFSGDERHVSGRVACGLGIIVIAALSITSILVPGAEADARIVFDANVAQAHGGLVGGGIAFGLLSSVGREVGIVVLMGLAVAGIVVCGFSISAGIMGLRMGLGRLRVRGVEAFRKFQEDSRQRAALREELRERREEEWADPYDGYDDGYDDRFYDGYDDAGGYDGEEPPTTWIGGRMRTVLKREGHEGRVAPPQAGTDEVAPTKRRPPVGEPVTTRIREAQKRTAVAPDAEAPVAKKKPHRRSGSRKANEMLASEMRAVQEGLPFEEDLPTTLAGAAASAAAASTEAAGSMPEFLSQPRQRDAGARAKGGKRKAQAKRPRKAAATTASETQQVADASVAVHTATRRPGDADETYALPPFTMLTSNPQSAQSASSKAELDQTMAKLQGTLREFGLTSRVVDYVSGPLVTTFRVEMGEGERVNKIRNLEDDIALTLAAEKVRIFAPIAGTSYVGIEIPNKTRQNVHLGDVLPSAVGGPLEVAIGRDSAGKPVIADIAKMPHMLVAGTTGSGKSVLINSMIMSLLMRSTPKQVRLIMVDPKRVEFKGYNGIPHLYVPVVTEPRQAASALQWAVSEMERRLKVFEKASARNITTYNEMCVSGKLAEMEHPPEPMPYLVIVIDELADLMMVAGKDVEASIVRIAQLARAAGIHLVIATQRPSANVVTGLIKSNIDSRVALKVSSGIDSRVILDETGADRLLGNGDMLFKDRGLAPKRVLGCYSSDAEIEAVVDFIRGQAEPDYHEEILSAVVPGQQGGGGVSEDDDPLIWEAAQIVVESRLGSTSGLQRRLKVGYARAGRIMDMLESKGIVGPSAGAKPREVLLDEEGLEELRVQEERYREV